ncbi:MAG: homocysteine S-methyltransferase family protein [Verrucomicrobiales bacterium]|nr:homocysteine S-methyltransferase family protein [Verrucomicrobiales bacterium]
MKKLLAESPLILAEAAIAERLRRIEGVDLHPTLFNTPLIYDQDQVGEMSAIYQQYIDLAQKYKLPIMLAAPTWRLDPDRVAKANVPATINTDAVNYMLELRDQAQQQHPASPPIKVGGLLGPKNDCYSPDQALSAEQAQSFHQQQAQELSAAGVDFLDGQTLPSVSEALGMAQAMTATGTPSIVSFCINRQGQVLDGHSLEDAIRTIDAELDHPLLGYMVNCAYPTFLCPEKQSDFVFSRLIGFQANASSLDTCELEKSNATQQESLEDWGDHMVKLNQIHGTRILGGCCGTTDQHLLYIAENA